MSIYGSRPPARWHMRPAEISLEPATGGDYALVTPYSPEFVETFKRAVPQTARRWDKDGRRWLLGAGWYSTVAALVEQTWGVKLPPQRTAAVVQTETRVLKLEYLGAAKQRDGCDELVAYGFVDGDWRLAVPVSVLRTWFLPGAEKPEEAISLYGVLGVARGVSQDELKRAYRRAARTWHPDVCHEPDATQQFQSIQHAYSVLSDDGLRRKYDCGLALAGSLRNERKVFAFDQADGMWKPPLRCGLVMVTGKPELGRFVVSQIVAWEDVIDERGRVMVTSWPRGAETFTVNWITQ